MKPSYALVFGLLALSCGKPEIRSSADPTNQPIVNPLAPGASRAKKVQMGAQYTLPPGYQGGIPK